MVTGKIEPCVIEILRYFYRPWKWYIFYCYFRQGCNCVKQIQNYAVKAIVIPFSFNFKVFLSENLLVQSLSSIAFSGSAFKSGNEST